MPAMMMMHDVDPVEKLLDDIGSLKKVEVFNNQVLVALYIRPEKTLKGIIVTEKARDEDIYQSKIGLIVKLGPNAFVDEKGAWFKEQKMKLNDWVISRPSDGWSISVNKVPCRLIEDVNIKGRVDHPDVIW